MNDFTWATVTATAPLRIRLDGDDVALPFAPDSLIDPLALAVDARVRCELGAKRIIVHGRSEDSRYTRSQVDALVALHQTSRRNRVVNGRGRINQRTYVSGAALANGAFGLDRWKAVTTNYISNPSGESATTGFTAVPGTTGVAAITNPTTSTAFGVKALRCTWSTASTAAGGGQYYELDIATEGLAVGDVISVGIFHLLTSISNRVQLSVEFRTGAATISTFSAAAKQTTAGTIITASTRSALPSDQYLENLTIPATCTKIRVRVLSVAGTGYANWSIASYLQLDALKINKGATLLDYSDGSTTVTFAANPAGQAMSVNALHAIAQPIEQANLEAGTYVAAWTGTARARVYKSGTASLPGFAASPLVVVVDGTADYVLELYDGSFDEVQLERGTVATPYENIPLGSELATCQRYYVRWVSQQAEHPIAVGFQVTTTYSRIVVPLPVTMRVAPTVTYSGLEVSNNSTFRTVVSGWASTPRIAGSSLFLAPTHAAAGAGLGPLVLELTNSGTSYMEASSEL